jgi:osmotically-inducible protein OsmY
MEGTKAMRTALLASALIAQIALGADEVSTFRSYVDTDLCARLMLGPITPSRVACSQQTAKENSEPVLVRLSNNMVFAVNKRKTIEGLVGRFAEVSGKVKVKAGTMKIQDAKPIDEKSIAAGDPDRRSLESTRAGADPKVWEKVRHELAMMPYTTVFDFISFTMSGSEVILTGWTVRQTNRDYAYNVVKDVKGVETVVNNIDILPLGSFDMQIRAGARASLQKFLSRYFWGSGSDIKIVVKNGQIILLGVVATKADSDMAYIQCNSVANAFKVFNMLRIDSSPKKGAPKAEASNTGASKAKG